MYLNTIEIKSTMMPAKAIIVESMVGLGSAPPTYAVRGSKKGVPAAHSIQIPKIAVN